MEQPEDIILVRVFPRGNPSLQPSIAYLGTGEVTKRNDTIVTSEQAFSALRESASIEEREKAVEFLVAGNSGNSTNGDDVIQALTAAISDTAPEIRVAAIEGLAAIEARGALAVILKSLRDSHPEVRRSAAMAVAAIGNAEDIGDLELLSTDEDAGVAAAAEMAITRLSATAKKVN